MKPIFVLLFVSSLASANEWQKLALEKYAAGDYNAARDLCEEMIKREPADAAAKETLEKSKTQLERLAREAFETGNLMESFNRIPEALQYWNRTSNYVRPGDKYYDRLREKLAHYN